MLLMLFKKASGMKKFTDGFLKTVCKKNSRWFFFKTVLTFVDGLGQTVCKYKFAWDKLSVKVNLQTVWTKFYVKVNL
jgi:hypothetical protein